MERRPTVDEMRRITNAEIRRYVASESPVCLDGLKFPGRQPKPDSREVLADLNDLLKVLDALQVTGVVPAEVSVARAVDERAYRFYPARIGKACDALFHGGLNLRKQVAAAQRITVVANRFRKLLQETAQPASLRRQ